MLAPMKDNPPTTRIEGENLDAMGMKEMPPIGSKVMTVSTGRVKSAHDGDEYQPRHLEIEHEHMHAEPYEEGDDSPSVREELVKARDGKK